MKYLDYEPILAGFLRTTGMSESEFRHDTLIENAESYVLAHIKICGEALTAEQRSLCEYAAAAVAVYDYCFERCLKKIPVMSENGEVSLKSFSPAELEAAKRLRDEALQRLVKAGLSEPQSFAFIGV